MLSESAFLAAVLDAPHSPAPRLVFADWLEERGDPWSELIRRQYQLGSMAAYADVDHAGRASPPHFDDATCNVIARCRQLLNAGATDWTYRCAEGGGVKVFNRKPWSAVDGDLVWWRRNSEASLFWWGGFPERARMTAGQWVSFHGDYMRSFPLWHLRLDTEAPRHGEYPLTEAGVSVLRSVEQYAGRLTTLDVPTWAPLNGFTAWTQAWMDRIGEACGAATGRPFTLKIGQAVLGGPPHSVQERWGRYVESTLKNSNVAILSRLDARPAGEALAGTD